MKRLAILFVAIIISVVSYSQEIKKFNLSMFPEKEFSFIASQYNGDFFIRIETVDDNYQPTYFEVLSLKEIEAFNNALKASKVKFNEYAEIAKQNNIKDFSKILDIEFPKLTLIWQISEWYSGPRSKPTACFFVIDGTCLFSVMKQSTSRTNSYIESEGSLHLMNDTDFDILIELTSPELIKKSINSAQKIENLFN